MKDFAARGIDSGLDMVAFADIQIARTFIDSSLIKNELGVTKDDIEAVIGNTVRLCLNSIEGKVKFVVE